jgi:ubiquinone/menaquinone biosynthesis C-methylase UbiE
MNTNHDRVCPSPEWAEHLHRDVLPAIVDGVDLGDRMLEIGPGRGAATEWLRHRVRRLLTLELDRSAARSLTARFANTNVEVYVGDATAMPWDGDSFDAVGGFTMLHHIPTIGLQNRVLAEAYRVLRPGGMLIGSDSLASDELHHFHEGDVYNPIEPASLFTRLQTVGFDWVTVAAEDGLRFRARKSPADIIKRDG